MLAHDVCVMLCNDNVSLFTGFSFWFPATINRLELPGQDPHTVLVHLSNLKFNNIFGLPFLFPPEFGKNAEFVVKFPQEAHSVWFGNWCHVPSFCTKNTTEFTKMQKNASKDGFASLQSPALKCHLLQNDVGFVGMIRCIVMMHQNVATY